VEKTRAATGVSAVTKKSPATAMAPTLAAAEAAPFTTAALADFVAEPVEASLGEPDAFVNRAQVILGILAIRNGRRKQRTARGRVDRVDFERNNVRPVGPRRGRQYCRQGESNRHCSPISEAHDHSLTRRSMDPSWSVRNRASGGLVRASYALNLASSSAKQRPAAMPPLRSPRRVADWPRHDESVKRRVNLELNRAGVDQGLWEIHPVSGPEALTGFATAGGGNEKKEDGCSGRTAFLLLVSLAKTDAAPGDRFV
jgi:hypothetical protein